MRQIKSDAGGVTLLYVDVESLENRGWKGTSVIIMDRSCEGERPVSSYLIWNCWFFPGAARGIGSHTRQKVQ